MTTKQKTILIIDDDEDMLKLLTKVLEGSGFHVLAANNPTQGRQLLAEEAPHVVLTDLHMEPEDGFSFIQSMRSQKQYSHIPLLVLSALNDFTSVKKAIALGVNDYVIKPLQSPMLLRKLKKALFNKDFVKWNPDEKSAPEVEINVPAEITSLGEAGYTLKGPFKVSSSKEIEIISKEIEELELNKVHHRASSLLKTYSNDGTFNNDIVFVGITEGISSKIRQYVSKRNTK